MAVSFGIERRPSSRTASPRTLGSLGSVLADRMASFRSMDRNSAPAAARPPHPEEESLAEARRCLSERFSFTLFPDNGWH